MTTCRRLSSLRLDVVPPRVCAQRLQNRHQGATRPGAIWRWATAQHGRQDKSPPPRRSWLFLFDSQHRPELKTMRAILFAALLAAAAFSSGESGRCCPAACPQKPRQLLANVVSGVPAPRARLSCFPPVRRQRWHLPLRVCWSSPCPSLTSCRETQRHQTLLSNRVAPPTLSPGAAAACVAGKDGCKTCSLNKQRCKQCETCKFVPRAVRPPYPKQAGTSIPPATRLVSAHACTLTSAHEPLTPSPAQLLLSSLLRSPLQTGTMTTQARAAPPTA